MAFRNLPEMPCGPILELHGQRKRFHVPYGLKKLLEDMTREVLRIQPDNIYEFLANFMTARGQQRKSEGSKEIELESFQEPKLSVGRTSVVKKEELTEFIESLGPITAEAEKHAVVIQSAFRGYQARKQVKQIRKSIDPIQQRKSIDASTARVEAKRLSSIGGPKPERKSLVETLTAENATGGEQEAAVKIQSAFRGMQARRLVKEKKSIRKKTHKSIHQAQLEPETETFTEEIQNEEEHNEVSQDQEPVAEENTADDVPLTAIESEMVEEYEQMEESQAAGESEEVTTTEETETQPEKGESPPAQ